MLRVRTMNERVAAIPKGGLQAVAVAAAGWLAEHSATDLSLVVAGSAVALEPRKTDLPALLIAHVQESGFAELQWTSGGLRIRLDESVCKVWSTDGAAADSFIARFSPSI